MPALTYIAFQGFVDERMERLISCFEKGGWSVEVVLIHPSKGWIAQHGGGRHVLVDYRIVSNPIVSELLLIPLYLLAKFVFEFPKLKSRVKFLYIHNFPDSFAIPFLLLAKLFRIPTVYEIRDPWKEFVSTETSESVRSRTRFKLYLTIISLIELTAASLTSAFVFATAALQDLHRESTIGKPTCLIRNYSDYEASEEVQAQGRLIRRRLRLEDNFVASYIGGGLQPYRGVDVLVKSMKIVSNDEPKAKLLVVGGHGEALASLRQQIRSLGLEDSCVVTGWVPSNQLAYYYMASDVGVIPHRRTSATELAVPNKFFDYLALGKPVIVTALGEMSVLVGNGVNGLTVRPDDSKDLADAILRLARDHRMVRRMEENASTLGQKYAFFKVEKLLLRFIEQVAETDRSPPIVKDTT